MAMGSPQARRGRGKRTPMAEINVTPMVDVMLVLLIIFMVTAPLLKAGVPVQLPESRAKALAEEEKQVVLSMSRDGKVYLDEAEVAPGEMPDRLAGLPRDGTGQPPQVTLRADRGLDYGAVMAVMGELNRAGFNRISLVTSAAGPVTPGSGAGE